MRRAGPKVITSLVLRKAALLKSTGYPQTFPQWGREFLLGGRIPAVLVSTSPAFFGDLMRDKLRNLVAELVRGGVPLEMACREFERIYIEEVLASHAGNQSAAARELGIHRNTLSRK